MTNDLRTHHRIALLLTVPLIASIGIDSAVRLTTGEPTFVTDDTIEPAYLRAILAATLGLAFLALHLVLRAERPRFEPLGRVPRATRLVMLGGTLLLGIGFLLQPLLTLAGVDAGAFYDATGIVATLGLGLTMLSAVTLGLSQVRTNRLGWGGRLLTLIVPAALLTAAIALVEPDLASPVLVTAVLLGGLSTIGAGAPAAVRRSTA